MTPINEEEDDMFINPEEPAIPPSLQDVKPLKRKGEFSPLPSTMSLPLSLLDTDQRFVLPRSIGESRKTFLNLSTALLNTIHGPKLGGGSIDGTGSGHEDTTADACGLCSHTSSGRTSEHSAYRTG
ncbi:hypothetical protein DPMN_159969 [Dreissena polymorpha]|uniref:Uncharacterized protein n=1 Tax=Dreissena polymorpha TaxID=45954 RepID=A0A9D4IS55_DREPO|nr:hypothetical protein DPMN_159969 [Dreissena polymorpha]